MQIECDYHSITIGPGVLVNYYHHHNELLEIQSDTAYKVNGRMYIVQYDILHDLRMNTQHEYSQRVLAKRCGVFCV